MLDDRSPLAIGPSRRVNRRTFLRATGAAAGLAATPWIRRAHAVQDAATPQPTLSDAAWDDLAKRLRGRLLRPGDDLYPPATVVNATRYMGVRPAGIAVCVAPEDAAACVTWARETGVPFAVRSGGHSYAGFSTSDGLVIDVKGMRSVTVDSGAGTAIVAGGANNTDAALALLPQGVYFPGGRCPTVGVSGLTLGGGWGFSCRHLGMTCDNLIETELVTPRGDIVRASEQENADLFWAVRGSAGGNFGVHTSFTYRLVPTTGVTVFQLSWSGGETGALLDALLRLQLDGPNELLIRIGVGSQSRMPLSQPGLRVVNALGLYWGPATEAAELLAAVERIQAPSARTVEEVGFEAGREFLAHTTPIGAYQIKSGFVQGALPAAAITTMLDWIDQMPGGPYQVPEPSVAIFGFGGKVKDLAPDATAFVHRREDFLFTCSTGWEPEETPDLIAANLEWQDGFYAAMHPYLSGGAYQNFPDRGLADWPRAYYGANLERLVATKRTWDPDNLFRSPQSIPLSL